MTMTTLPTAPLPTDDTSTFNTRAFALVAALSAFVTEANALEVAADADAVSAAANAISAANSALAATGAANFKGEWSTLTGALAIPASVSHSGKVWILTASVANIAAETPGVSSKWIAAIDLTSPGIIGGTTPNIGNFTTVNTQNTFGFKNRIINGGFIINQRVYVSGTALASGAYAHDRWKAGASGCTYTFTQGASGVNTTITITAGSLQQVIEGCNIPEGGTYALSWTGTAQARFNGGSYGPSPLAVTGITAGANVKIEFNTGTVDRVQIEVGSTATSFDVRDYGREMIMCQRYAESSSVWVSPAFDPLYYKASKRATPTVSGGGAGFSSGGVITTEQTYVLQTTGAFQTLLFIAEL